MSPLIFHRLGQNLALATVNNFKKKPNKDLVTFNEVLNCQIQKKKLLVIHGVAAASYTVKLITFDIATKGFTTALAFV